RWGDDSFLVVTRSTVRDQGDVLADRILKCIATDPFPLPAGPAACTASIGWAPFPWSTASPAEVSFEEVLRYADRARERAVTRGGNRAVGALPVPAGVEPAEGGPRLPGAE